MDSSNAKPPEGSGEAQPFELRSFSRGVAPSYQKIKATFSPQASQTNGRFSLSELVSNQLSVEKEEAERFERRVQTVVAQRLGELRVAAEKEAFAKGFEEGKEKAYSEEKARLALQMERLASVISSIEQSKNNLAETYRDHLIDLGFRLARVLVHREIVERPQGVADTIQTILGRLGKEDELRIRLSAKDYEVLNQVQAQIEGVARGARIHFEIDANLKSGDCVVESNSGEVGSFLDEKFEKLKREVVRNGAEAVEKVVGE